MLFEVQIKRAMRPVQSSKGLDREEHLLITIAETIKWGLV